MPNFLSNHPNISRILIGFCMGLMVMGGFWYGNRGAADIYESTIQRLEMELTQEEYQHEQLKIAHKELKTSFNESFEEVIKPDGTKIVKRITSSDMESSSSTQSHSIEKNSKKTEKTVAETAVKKSQTKDLTIQIHTNTKLHLGFDSYYRVLPPFSVGFGLTIDPNNPSVIKDLRLGIGIRL